MKRRVILLLIVGVLVLLPSMPPASAQTYSFSLDREVVDVYWEADGSLTIDYELTFTNDLSADPIDIIDIGVPSESYSLSSVTASVDGQAITDISSSPYVSPGVALGLGSYAIRPGNRGVVLVSIPNVRDVLYSADVAGYASGLFTSTWFDSSFVHGATDLTVRFHLPPGVNPEEPRWHSSPSGWPEEAPSTSLDSNGRVTYTWHDANADGSRAYVFGASFPSTYVPAGVVQTPTVSDRLSIDSETLTTIACCAVIAIVMLIFVVVVIRGAKKARMAYLPPKMSIEGHGIKRGLTAVEAAILLETPLERVMTMVLFSVVKKGAAKVVSEEPLQVQAITPEPEGVREYEKGFLEAMAVPRGVARDKALQKVMIDLVKSVQAAMKGFSLRETKDFYRAIVQKAWKQVEEAQTPEVRSQRYAEDIEWTMLDRDFDDRTRRVFRTGPVFVPIWWGSYRPSYRPSTAAPSIPSSRTTSGPAGRVALPSLPGSSFAASVARGIQNTAGSLAGGLVSFTSGVTRTTNPPPPPPRVSSSFRGGGGGGGHSCACACACAGCACACAGGGR